jgi:outer membrane protein insertion porin family
METLATLESGFLKPSMKPSKLLTIAFILKLLGAVCFGDSSASAQEAARLKDVRIGGNVRVEEDGIRLHVKSRPGDPFNPTLVEQDVRAIYRMGFFDDVQAELSPDNVLTYAVKEKPYIREVRIQGLSQVSKDKVETALGVSPRTILDRSKVSEGVDKVRKLFTEQGYVNAAVDFAISPEANNQVAVVLDIVEGNRLLIKRISFEGNKAFSESELKDLLTTKEEWIFSYFTNRGVLDRDILTNDVAILSNHYNDNGYVENKVDEPLIVRAKDGLEVIFRVSEGPQYRVGRVEIGGELIEDGQKMLKSVKLTTGQIFRGNRLREDVTTLNEMYANKGFAFVQVDPMTQIDQAKKLVDVALVINKGPPVYFNRVLIAGNTKTRDKVVRRELVVNEQELYSGVKVTQSRNALQRTGYFEDVQLNTKKTDQPDALDLNVDVKEGPTGTFQVGAGYSSGDGFLFNANVSEKNLMGRGQSMSGNFSIGSSRQDYIFNLTDPYFLDSKVSLGMDAFNTTRDYTDFNEKKMGFGVNSSYPLKGFTLPFFNSPASVAAPGSDADASQQITYWDFMRAGLAYDFTHENITGVSAGASQSIKDEEGKSLTSSVTPGLTYDSRDHFFTPSEGSKLAISTKMAGLGGDNRFLKTDLTARWYYTLLKDPSWGGAYVLGLGGQLGYGLGFAGNKDGGNDLPLFERYFLGGINSIRGFAERSIGPRSPSGCDSNGQNCTGTEVTGGDKAVVLNAEVAFPVMEQYGLRGVVFFDVGNSFDSFNFSDMRRSVGFGGRWMSPFGPLRVDLGFPITKKSGDETSVLGFSVGAQP